MKFVIASDIHGSAHWCRELLKAFDKEKADRLLLLGDILYHGPRNDLPQEYAPGEVVALLNERADKIFCVRGNCDAEVDQMLLKFPVMAEYAVLSYGNKIIYAAHGHKDIIPLSEGDMLMCGHTHIPICEKKGGILLLNDGSVSIPKENSPHSYMTLEENRLEWIDIESGEPYMSYEVQ